MSLGTTESMLGYLRLMTDSILSLGMSNYGMDQAIHNVLLHSVKWPVRPSCAQQVDGYRICRTSNMELSMALEGETPLGIAAGCRI